MQAPLKIPAAAPNIVWPLPPAAARIRFIESFSGPEDFEIGESFSQSLSNFFAGAEDRGMLRPYAIAVSDPLIAIADPGGAAVHVYNKARKSYQRIKKVGSHLLVSPVGVALAGGLIYIADSELDMVFILDKNQRLAATLEGLQRPTGIVFDTKNGILFVAETTGHRVVAFDRNYEQVFSIGGRGNGDGEFNYPTHLAISGEQLIVNDTMNFRLQVFSPDGAHQRTFGRHGDGSGNFAQPKGVAVDSEGHIYVADAVTNHVQIFDQQGRFLLGFGGTGSAAGEFNVPAGLAIVNDRVYVADSYNKRVQVFKYLSAD
jgi:DNA-binding beta-propeller fold protein YncE